MCKGGNLTIMFYNCIVIDDCGLPDPSERRNDRTCENHRTSSTSALGLYKALGCSTRAALKQPASNWRKGDDG